MRDLAPGRQVSRCSARRWPDGACPHSPGRPGVTALTALGWVLSYTALRQLALSASMPTWAATLWPPGIDLFVFVATLGDAVGPLLCGHSRRQRHGRRGRSHGPGRTRYASRDDGLARHLLSRFLTAGDSSAMRRPAQTGSQASDVSGDARGPRQAAQPNGVRKRSGPSWTKWRPG